MTSCSALAEALGADRLGLELLPAAAVHEHRLGEIDLAGRQRVEEVAPHHEREAEQEQRLIAARLEPPM